MNWTHNGVDISINEDGKFVAIVGNKTIKRNNIGAVKTLINKHSKADKIILPGKTWSGISKPQTSEAIHLSKNSDITTKEDGKIDSYETALLFDADVFDQLDKIYQEYQNLRDRHDEVVRNATDYRKWKRGK